jgi:hypothetical protein
MKNMRLSNRVAPACAFSNEIWERKQNLHLFRHRVPIRVMSHFSTAHEAGDAHEDKGQHQSDENPAIRCPEEQLSKLDKYPIGKEQRPREKPTVHQPDDLDGCAEKIEQVGPNQRKVVAEPDRKKEEGEKNGDGRYPESCNGIAEAGHNINCPPDFPALFRGFFRSAIELLLTHIDLGLARWRDGHKAVVAVARRATGAVVCAGSSPGAEDRLAPRPEVAGYHGGASRGNGDGHRPPLQRRRN